MRVMALLLLIAAPALAQTPPPGAPGARATPLERLKAADANKDGFVTPEELQSGMDKLRAMGLAPPE